MWRGSPPFARPLPLAKGNTGVVPPRDPKSGAAAPTPVGWRAGATRQRVRGPLYPSPRPRLYAGATRERGRLEGTGHPPILADKPIGGGGGGGTRSPPPCSRAGATCKLQAARAQKRPPPPFCACPLRSFTRAWESGVRTPFAPAFAQNREGWGGAQTKRVCRPPAWFVRRPVAQPFLPKRLRADGVLGGGRWGVTRKWDETPEVGWGALVYTRGARK
ncbi:hypothetical protein EDB86DRAFT_2833979 [Lactarius hatsudake]|nr:hypothetical protein EDB86DRAFT_2833979 [Lactarius hatsudake]